MEGVLAGRFSHSSTSSVRPTTATDYRYHVTGWNSAYFDRSLAPRAWEIVLNNDFKARLRIDRGPDGSGFTGRLKVYANTTMSPSELGEEPEYDLEVTQWDGTTLRFLRRNPAWTQEYTGTVSGRTISGTFTHAGTGSFPWRGTRAEVLTYGYGMYKGPNGRRDWQERTRRQLQHLMMAGNPSPAGVSRTTTAMTPIASVTLPAERDDDPDRWPQSYTLTQIVSTYTFPVDQHGNTPGSRQIRTMLAVPTTAAPAGGRYPAVLAVNGHGGNAREVMNPDSGYFWYGDAFARRGFIVLAVDITHRPPGDRQPPSRTTPLYGDPARSDDHPSIKATGFDSDWEEDGERAWDAMRGIDTLLTRSDVDPDRIVVTGLSMGGEITTIVGGLDPRVAVSLPSGFSPDLALMLEGNHECWQWLHAETREYVDTSDFYALTAPRPLIIQTGKVDGTYSRLAQPFASEKEVARRARVAYGGETANFLQYLHYDEHHYHVGDVNKTNSTRERDVRIPELIAPTEPWQITWQTDSRTFRQNCTLFECVAFYLRQPR